MLRNCLILNVSIFKFWREFSDGLRGLAYRLGLKIFHLLYLTAYLNFHVSHLTLCNISLKLFVIHRYLRAVCVCKSRCFSLIVSWRSRPPLVEVVKPLLKSIIHFLKKLSPHLFKMHSLLSEHVLILVDVVLHVHILFLPLHVLLEESLPILHHSDSLVFKHVLFLFQ